MKIHVNDLLWKLDQVDHSLSLLVTEGEGVVDWKSVPNSELEIIDEKVDMIKNLVELLFTKFETYAHR